MQKNLLTTAALMLGLYSQAQQSNPLSNLHPKQQMQVVKEFPYKTVSGEYLFGQQAKGMADFPTDFGNGNLKVNKDPENGMVISLEGAIAAPSLNKPLALLSAKDYFGSYFLLSDPSHELEQTEVVPADMNGIGYEKYSQTYKSVPVYGTGLTVRIEHGIPNLATGRIYPTPSLADVNNPMDASRAVLIAKSAISKTHEWKNLQGLSLELVGGNQVTCQLVIFHKNNQPDGEVLAWHVVVHPDAIHMADFMLNAHTGETIENWESHCTANGPRTANANDLKGVSRTVNTYEQNGTFYLINAAETMFSSSGSSMPNSPKGVIWTLDANGTDGSGSIFHNTTTNNSGWTSTAVSAHFNAKTCYDYYKTTHNRNSINGTGGNITSIINVTEANGSGLDNAYWNGTSMFYGNGKNAFTALAKALDVAGHEMTHGVVQATANLEYKNQSGAINESMADVFGCLIENINYKIGEDITKTSYIATGTLRDMSDPHNGGNSLADNGWQPSRMKEFYSGTQDNGGVHINSGIPNHAFYLIANQIGKAKAGAIYYKALSIYLKATSKFLDLRYAIVNAATDIHGAASTEVAVVKSAFDQVEIYDPNAGSSGNTGIDLQTNPGQDFILSYDVDYQNVGNRCFKSNTTATSFLGLSDEDAKAPVSVTDKGDKAYYAGKDAKIHSLDLTASSNWDAIIQNQAIWDNVAVSKDGTKFAGITTSIDSAIWLYDGSGWTKFHLYNPTTANGVNGAGVLFAGSLEWDYTGQYIIYDAFNKLNNNGTPISWWDVGQLKVWDLKTNTIGDGKVQKLFTNLPKDVSIGNPAFSKNSPHILAFDYIDDNQSNPYSVVGTNLATNTTKTIVTNATLSFPNYSKTDDKLLVYGEDQFGDTNLYIVPLKSTKIEGTGAGGSKLISLGKWGVWYSTGTRALLNSDKVITSFGFPTLNPAVLATINGTNISATVPAGTDVSTLIPTFVASPLASVLVAGAEQVSGASPQNFANPVSYTVRAQDGTTTIYTVTVTVQQGKSSAKDIVSYAFNGLSPVVSASIIGNSIIATVPAGTNIAALVATFVVSAKAMAKVGGNLQTSGSTPNNFTSSVTYTITAEDGSTKDYFVTVLIQGQVSSGKEILSFMFNGLTPPVKASIIGNSIVAQVPLGTNIGNMVATFVLSPKASASVGGNLQSSGSTPNNFSFPITYTVTAEDGSTKDYVVTVQKSNGIATAAEKALLEVWPVPSADKLYFISPNGARQLQVIDLTGRILLEENTLPNTLTGLSLDVLPQGTYILKIIGTAEPFYARFVKE